jgi:hypothetical protein
VMITAITPSLKASTRSVSLTGAVSHHQLLARREWNGFEATGSRGC